MIFVDTGAWFAVFVPNDADHAAADAWLNNNADSLVTTDYIVDELLTLMKRRGEYDRAVKAGELLLNASVAQLEWVTSADVKLHGGYFGGSTTRAGVLRIAPVEQSWNGFLYRRHLPSMSIFGSSAMFM